MNSIHDTAQLIGDVSLGDGNTIGPFVVIVGPVTIGDGNWIGTGVVIGAPPEIRSWQHPTDASRPASGNGIRIGNGNTIREYAQIHQGWKDVTRLDDDVFVMNQSYVAHDCVLENGVTLASSVLLAGHVRVGRMANLGLGSSVHQHRYIGEGAMVGMGSVVTTNVPPYATAFGNPSAVRGANVVGMERAGFTAQAVDAAVASYRDFRDPNLTGWDGMPSLARALSAWRRHAPS
jgi:UDP-N-acetylglucosamine acyltransferase